MTTNLLTIVMTLKDRPLFTMRIMRYLNATEFPFLLLIADGGKNRRIERILAEKKAFPRINYEYVRYPQDASYQDYFRNWKSPRFRASTP